MVTMANCFSVPVGLSDHSVGHIAAVMAIAMGAKVIEKHFTLDKSMQGPDHKASSTPVEFSALVQSVRRAESILGSSQKKRQLEELDMAVVSRKSLTLVRDIMAGEVLSDSDIRLMRPGTGIEPFFIDRFIGKVTRINLKAGSQLKWSDIESSI
jgi:sialic acid synthase SpsE